MIHQSQGHHRAQVIGARGEAAAANAMRSLAWVAGPCFLVLGGITLG